MEADGFRANRVEKIRGFAELVDFYCESNEIEAERVKKKTGEEFYMWLELKVKRAKKLQGEVEKIKGKRK